MSQTTADSAHHTVDIVDMLKNLSSTPSKPSMFRVDDHLRDINPKAYDPEIIAIGPFHHGSKNEKLQKMEQHKLRYLKLLLERENGVETLVTKIRKLEDEVETLVTEIRKLEDEARKCYPEDIVPNQDKGEFVQMLILDGCFIIEFLLKFTTKVKKEEDDPIFQYGYIKSHVLHDLMVFENQIPFFTIECLFIKICKGDIKILIRDWLENCFFPKPNLPEGFKIDGDHLLGIVHDMHCPSLSDDDCGDSNKMKNINSALELEKAGISFQMLKTEDKNSAEAKQLKKKVMFHIEYGNKVMKIPEWKISDSTESLFRNLIAYEYYLPDSSQRYVTDYVYLMNCLVRSSEDAKLLRRRGIISNLLGSDEMVYDIIKKLGKNTILSDKFSYFKIFFQVNSHCDHRWNRWMAMLRRKYFNSPWAIISVIAAIILLGLTIIQTVFAILSFQQNDL